MTLVDFLRGPLGPRRQARRVLPNLTSDAHGNIWAGGTAISGPAATSYTAGAQGSTGGHPIPTRGLTHAPAA